MNQFHRTRPLACVIGLALVASSLQVQAQNLGVNVSIKDTRRYASLTMNHTLIEDRVKNTLAVPGHAFVAFEFEFTITWNEKTSRLRLDDALLTITTDKDAACPRIGAFSKRRFSGLATGTTLYRPMTWRTGPDTTRHTFVYLVPDSAEKLKIKLGGLSGAVSMPKKVSTQPNPADDVSVKVNSAELVSNMARSRTFGNVTKAVTVVNPGGKFLKVTCTITPKRADDAISETLSFSSFALAARIGGVPTRCIGERTATGLSSVVEHDVKVGVAKTCTLYYAAPNDARGFELLWFGYPVAKHDGQDHVRE